MRISFYTLLVGIVLLTAGCTAQQVAAVLGNMNAARPVSESEAASGIQAALDQGVAKSIAALNARNGFFGSNVYKLFLPPEAEKIASALETIGMGSLVNQAVETINRAAEDAVGTAAPIFTNAIKSMTITDALGIVRGGKTSATDYFRTRTSTQLKAAFMPSIQQSLSVTGATRYYSDIVNAYNAIPLVTRVNPDLADYVADKAIFALFDQIAKEEENIRTNPLARGSEILQRVFGSIL
jgi:hypothetical protein